MSVIHKSSSTSPELSLPPGFRFQPSEEELVGYFLSAQLLGITNLGIQLPVVDINGKDPTALAGFSQDSTSDDIYLFSKVPKNWEAENGTWKKKNVSSLIKENGMASTLPALKTSYVFESKGTKREWVMHEFKYAEKNPLNFPSDFAMFHICKNSTMRATGRRLTRPCKLATRQPSSLAFPKCSPTESFSGSSSNGASLKRPRLLEGSSSSLSGSHDYGNKLKKLCKNQRAESRLVTTLVEGGSG